MYFIDVFEGLAKSFFAPTHSDSDNDLVSTHAKSFFAPTHSDSDNELVSTNAIRIMDKIGLCFYDNEDIIDIGSNITFKTKLMPEQEILYRSLRYNFSLSGIRDLDRH